MLAGGDSPSPHRSAARQMLGEAGLARGKAEHLLRLKFALVKYDWLRSGFLPAEQVQQFATLYGMCSAGDDFGSLMRQCEPRQRPGMVDYARLVTLLDPLLEKRSQA